VKHTLTRHVVAQALAKGWNVADIQAAADYPQTTYANGRYPNQMRHIRNGIVAIVNVLTGEVVTCYANVVETELRADQRDRDAQAYGRRRQGR
jgi:hypothetical protein